jgi:hypothetical protein
MKTSLGKRSALLLISLSLVLLCFFLRSAKEPQYKGRSLSQWLATTYDIKEGRWIVGRSSEFNAAMQAMGTNTIPYLVRMLASEDPPMSQFLMEHVFKDMLHPAWNRLGMNHAFFQRERAAKGFEALGSQATNAIPALLVHPPTAQLVYALNGIGREGQPIVLQFLHDGDADVKFTCLFALQASSYDRKVAVEKWIQHTTNALPKLRFAGTALLMTAPREFADDVLDAARRGRADSDRRVATLSSSLVERYNTMPVGNILVP